ncbi:MAG: ATP-binding cassette domain-containing protein, partial [Gammaproteobacteria bacterium]|nr:ATP-binding cassette domain-containing protein [Gammaproteobacteria bacterium]
MSLVNLHQVHKYYGDNHVLKGIDLDIKAGEVVSIIGKSGSGKSTLLRCINGLEQYQEGGITVDGKEVTTEDIQVRRLALSVGMIFQNFNLFPHMTVGENVMLAPTIVLKKSKAEAETTARAML